MTGLDEVHILIVSPSLALQELIGQWQGGVPQCQSVSDSDQAVQQIDTAHYDLIILDMSQEENNDGARHILAKCGRKIPVIMLRDPPSSSAYLSMVESGCILQKPIRATALFEAMSSYLLINERPLLLGELYFFPRGRFLSAHEKALTEQEKLKLTEKEASILQFLYQHKNNIVDREELLLGVWGYHSGIDTHTLETHVYRLRQKIAEFFNGKDLIITQSGGYSLK